MNQREWTLELLRLCIREVNREPDLSIQKRPLVLWKVRLIALQLAQKRAYTHAFWARELLRLLNRTETVREAIAELKREDVLPPASNTGVTPLSETLGEYFSGGH